MSVYTCDDCHESLCGDCDVPSKYCDDCDRDVCEDCFKKTHAHAKATRAKRKPSHDFALAILDALEEYEDHPHRCAAPCVLSKRMDEMRAALDDEDDTEETVEAVRAALSEYADHEHRCHEAACILSVRLHALDDHARTIERELKRARNLYPAEQATA